MCAAAGDGTAPVSTRTPRPVPAIYVYYYYVSICTHHKSVSGAAGRSKLTSYSTYLAQVRGGIFFFWSTGTWRNRVRALSIAVHLIHRQAGSQWHARQINVGLRSNDLAA